MLLNARGMEVMHIFCVMEKTRYNPDSFSINLCLPRVNRTATETMTTFQIQLKSSNSNNPTQVKQKDEHCAFWKKKKPVATREHKQTTVCKLIPTQLST